MLVSATTSADVALLVLRSGVGVMLVVHGANKVFGSGGLAGTARWFESLGMRPGWLQARVAAATEVGSGLLLVAGLLVPLDCAAVIGLMTVAAATDHRGKGFFVFKGGWEYVALVGLVAAVIACVGPGRWSIDYASGLRTTGVEWAAGAVAIGLISAVATVVLARRWPRST
jgi:putative oxidoreductase